MNTILIADKEQAYRHQIRQHIGIRGGFRVIGESESCFETIRMIDALEPDILFLDVQLGGEKTFDLIGQIGHLPQIIYTARSDSYAREAFDHQALDYLLKPYGTARLETALQKITDRRTTAVRLPGMTISTTFRQSLFVEQGKRLKRISVSDILYFRAAGDYTTVSAVSGEYLSSSGIGTIERKVDPVRFTRVHRSFIINAERIDFCYRDIGRLYLVMENGQEIAVGKNYHHNIKHLIL